MNAPSATGIAAAIFASLTWSMNFVAPFLIGDYSIFDLAACRFLFSGLFGIVFLMVSADICRGLTLQDWLAAAGLGFVGYVGYFLAVMAAAVYAGPVIPPAFLGLVPVVLAIASNFHGRSIPWRALLVPLALAAAGLLVVNGSNVLHADTRGDSSLAIGIGYAIAAVALWTWFGIANQSALRMRPGMDARVWTALMMIGGAIQTLVFLPVGHGLELFRAPELGLGATAIGNLYLPAILLAAVASIGGAWAWTIASQRLPMALAGQLLMTEIVFATCFGLMARSRWPTAAEVIGIALIVVGVVLAVGTFHARRAGNLQG